MMLRGVCFEMREGVLTRGGLRLGAFISMMRVAGNDLGAEGGAAVGQSLKALTALQTLDLSCKALSFVMLWGGLFCDSVLGSCDEWRFSLGHCFVADSRCRQPSRSRRWYSCWAIADGADGAADNESVR